MDRLDFAGFRGQHFGKQDLPFGREEAQAALGNSPQLLAGTLQACSNSLEGRGTNFVRVARKEICAASARAKRTVCLSGWPSANRKGLVRGGKLNCEVVGTNHGGFKELLLEELC